MSGCGGACDRPRSIAAGTGPKHYIKDKLDPRVT